MSLYTHITLTGQTLWLSAITRGRDLNLGEFLKLSSLSFSECSVMTGILVEFIGGFVERDEGSGVSVKTAMNSCFHGKRPNYSLSGG